MANPAQGWSRPIALVVAAAFFIEQLDGTVLATALPVIADEFDVAPADVGITMTAYLLAVALFIPVAGWLAERIQPRTIFLCAIILFTLASLACALSTTLPQLTLARVAQGIAGSMLVPIGRLIVLRTTSKSELIRAIAYLTWPALVAPVIAPLLGGFLAQYAGWPWIFYINIPFGIVLTVAAWRLLPTSELTNRRPFDPIGLLFIGGAIVTLMIGMELIVDPVHTLVAATLLGFALISAMAAVRHARRATDPLLPPVAYRYPSFRLTNSSGIFYRIAVSSAPFLLPLLLQDGFGWSPVMAGAMVMWVFVGNVVIKPFTTPLLRHLGFTGTIVGASVGLAATFIACMLMQEETPVWLISTVFLLSGVFRSVGFTAYGTLQFADVPQEEMNGANTLSATLVQLATGLGIAVAAVAVRLIDLTVGEGEGGVIGYRGALLVMVMLTAASVIGALRLPPGTAAMVRAAPTRK